MVICAGYLSSAKPFMHPEISSVCSTFFVKFWFNFVGIESVDLICVQDGAAMMISVKRK